MPMQYEDFNYSGPAVLKRPDASPADQPIEGVATVSGKTGTKLIPIQGHNPVPGLKDVVSLSGSFRTTSPIPGRFAPSFPVKNGHMLALTGKTELTTALPCTIERTDDERTVKIVHAGYRH
jgi:hypothetical protein